MLLFYSVVAQSCDLAESSPVEQGLPCYFTVAAAPLLPR
ncbi:hypothetical protein ApDm4_0355 [Acetobacter pomorum]|nr:hypothetical protein ApDm4_0355 [Acetobacter pomorum]